MDLAEILKSSVVQNASDIHLTVNTPPVLRIDGELIVIKDTEPFTEESLKKLIYSFLSDQQKEVFEKDWELDFSLKNDALDDRFRVNVHFQKGATEATLRRIPKDIPPIESLGLPSVIREFANLHNGLLLFTGITGSGKTTSMASLIQLINATRRCHIMCVEDPIEFIYENDKAIVKQREIFKDTHSFPEALKRCLRQDPDVIVVGEMRDLDTISTALTAAETGHLVLGTLHTLDAPQTVDRVIDVFPPHQQHQVRMQLAGAIQGVVSQQLLPLEAGSGRALAAEVMIATPGIRNMIREQATEQIRTAIQTGGQYGMQTMDKAIKILYEEGKISYEMALNRATNPDELKTMLGG